MKPKMSRSSSSSVAAGLTGAAVTAATSCLALIPLDSSIGFAEPYATIMSITKTSNKSVSFMFDCRITWGRETEYQQSGLTHSVFLRHLNSLKYFLRSSRCHHKVNRKFLSESHWFLLHKFTSFFYLVQAEFERFQRVVFMLSGGWSRCLRDLNVFWCFL